jgi:hypothetical protein
MPSAKVDITEVERSGGDQKLKRTGRRGHHVLFTQTGSHHHGVLQSSKQNSGIPNVPRLSYKSQTTWMGTTDVLSCKFGEIGSRSLPWLCADSPWKQPLQSLPPVPVLHCGHSSASAWTPAVLGPPAVHLHSEQQPLWAATPTGVSPSQGSHRAEVSEMSERGTNDE